MVLLLFFVIKLYLQLSAVVFSLAFANVKDLHMHNRVSPYVLPVPGFLCGHIYIAVLAARGDSESRESRQHRRERERERGKLERPRVMVSKEQNKRGALHEKLKILRSVTHSHAVTVVISFSLSHVVHSSS